MSAVRAELHNQIDLELEGMRSRAVARLWRSHGESAEDVFQEAALKAFQRTETYDATKGEVRPWLSSIVHNAGVDQGIMRSRRQKRFQFVPNPEETLERHEAGKTPEEVIVFSERDQVIREAIAGLSDIHREVVELAFFNDLTQVEIAEALQMPLGTIKSRAKRALENLGKNPNVQALVAK